MSDASPWARRFSTWNAETRDSWRQYAGHRARQMKFLLRGPQDGSLAVLGAGNANDLDLPALLQHYARVELIDWDADALKFGASQQGVSDSPRLEQTGGIDLTGVAELLEPWESESKTIDAAALDRAIAAAARPDAPLAREPFDVVASTTLLTQIMTLADRALPSDHPKFRELVGALRLGHLRLLLSLAKPGGLAVLISDFVSSDSAPRIADASDDEAPRLAEQLLAAGNFLLGSHPLQIMDLLKSRPDLAAQVAEAQLVRPWRWDFGARTYLVYAVNIRKTTLES